MTYRYEYLGPDPVFGRAIWSCTRTGAGIAGYGPTQKEALEAFLDLEDQLLPTPKERDVEDQITEALLNDDY